MKNLSQVSRVAPYFQFAGMLCLSLLMGCGDDGNTNPRNTEGEGPAPVSGGVGNSGGVNGPLTEAGSFVILTKTGISNVTGSTITGNIAVSPAAATYLTGFGLSADPTNVFSTSSSVVGKVYAADYAVPTPTNLTTAIGDMETAYNDAAGRTPADFNELETGNIGGLTLAPGLYTWTTAVTIPTDVTIAGSATDVWIFQTTGDVTIDAAKRVILSGGALAKNIYWQVAGKVVLGSTAHFEGIILTKTAVTFGNLATMNGRVFAQTRVNLDDNDITEP